MLIVNTLVNKDPCHFGILNPCQNDIQTPAKMCPIIEKV